MSKLKVNQVSKTTAGAATFTLPAADGTSGQYMKTDGGGALSFGTPPDVKGIFESYAIIADVKSSGVAGGGLTAGSWSTRDLQTELADPDDIVSIATNQFTLAAGNYLVEWSCAVQSTARSQTRLYDVTGTAAVVGGLGMNVYSNGIPWGVVRITPSSSNIYRIEHRVETTIATYGAGGATSYGDGEVYTKDKIFKEA